MKLVYATILGSFLLLFNAQTQAQESDTAIATRNALRYADSIVKASFFQNWKTYTELSNPAAIKYYGGPQQFKEHVIVNYFRNAPQLEEKPETIQVIEMRSNMDQWQCVVEKTRKTFTDGRKTIITTYLVGQSLDAGETWKYLDVSHNSLDNLGNIFPAIFDDLGIPLGKTVFPDEVVAQQPAEEVAPKTAAKKKTTAKKR
jgi:hypothetical protein